MEKFLTIVVVIEGAIIGLLALLQMQRSKQVLEERRKTAEERTMRVKAEIEASKARRLLKAKINEVTNDNLTDEEADRELDRLLGDDPPSSDGS